MKIEFVGIVAIILLALITFFPLFGGITGGVGPAGPAGPAGTGGTSCDGNTDCNITGRINTNYDANFNRDLNVEKNVYIDGNILAYTFNAPTISQGYALGVSADMWAFCVIASLPTCSGLKFINTGRRGFDFTISAQPIAHFGAGTGQGAFWFGTRTTDPTVGSQDRNQGTMFIKSIGAFQSNIITDGNIGVINIGTFSAPQWERWGARQIDLNLGMKINHQTGTHRCAGMAVLASGTVTVNTTCMEDVNSMVMITKQGKISAGVTPLQVENKIYGTSFDIRDSNTSGDANVFWTISKLFGA